MVVIILLGAGFCYHYLVVNPSIYRAYDIRGIYPRDLDTDGAEYIAKELNKKLFKKGAVVVAHDVRKSSPLLYKAVIKGLKGREVIKVGPATTPMFYFLAVSRKAVGGIMITASHNPSEWNGLKVVGPKVMPVSGSDIKKIIENK